MCDAVTCATEPAQRHGVNNEQVVCLLPTDVLSFFGQWLKHFIIVNIIFTFDRMLNC